MQASKITNKKFERDTIRVPHEIKQMSADYINQILMEIEKNIGQGPEYVKACKDFKKFSIHFMRKYEPELLRKMDREKVDVLFREISRFFEQEQVNKVIWSKIKRVVSFRLEELRRETKDHKWNILNLLFDKLMRDNMQNKDLFEKFQFLDLPNDFRQKVWALCLLNKPSSEEYRKKYHDNRLTTVSKFDVQIAKDSEDFINKHMLGEAFDGKMIYTMKVVLSYYERKQDRILSDYLYYLAIPLIKVFGNSQYIMHPPVDLVGFYVSIINMVKQIDPLVDIVAQHDEKYDALMTDLFMNSLNRVDGELAIKMTEFLKLDQPVQRNMLVSLVKRFVHSLGFEFLNMRNALFLWDQMIMRVYPMGVEIYLVMAITMLCLKEEIMELQTWDQFLDFYYKRSKTVDFSLFSSYYKEIFSYFPYYYPQYENAEISEVLYEDLEDSADVEKSQIVDLSKKPSNKPKQPKVYSTLLNKPLNPAEELEEVKALDPHIERALKENIKDEGVRAKQQIGMVPFVNINEEEPDALDDL